MNSYLYKLYKQPDGVQKRTDADEIVRTAVAVILTADVTETGSASLEATAGVILTLTASNFRASDVTS